MKNTDEMDLNGHLKIRDRDSVTGEILSETEFSEHNVVTVQGASIFLERATQSQGGSYISTIYLGDDVGTGNLLNPEEERESYTGVVQQIVYEVPVSDITITYPDPFTFEVNTVLNGTTILENNFPFDIDMRFSSATIRFANGDAFAYKRFPVRSLSRLVDIELVWTVSLKEIPA